MDITAKYLYIHFPFCKKNCDFCDFYKLCNSHNKMNNVNDYFKRLENQLSKLNFKNQLVTIYIGGGTPNYLNDEELIVFLKIITKYFPYYILEFTIELNPEFITNNQLMILKEYGINRLSIGIQSTNEIILEKLNRNNGNNLLETILSTKKIFSNISLDFIFNLPSQQEDDLKRDIEFIRQIQPTHISWYSLILKENTKLFYANYTIDPDLDYKYYKLIINSLKHLGYKQYEISSFSINNYAKSLHNLAYWTSKEWYALGPSAMGFINFESNYYEVANSKNIDWNTTLNKISEKEYIYQVIIMGLRLKDGIILDNIQLSLLNKYYKLAIKDNIAEKLIKFNSKTSRIYCTPKGYLLLNNVLEKF